MPWIKLDDGYADHPKMAEAGPLAAWLHTKALIFCGRHLTDGRISRTVVASLVDWRAADVLTGVSNTVTNTLSNSQCSGYGHPDNIALADRLVEIGLWEHHDNGLAYRIHDYLEYQPSRAEVLEERRKNRERVKRHRERAKANGNAVTNADSTGTPIPIPSPKKKQKKTEEAYAQLTLDRVSNAVTSFDFEAVYALYPRKEGKTRGLAKCTTQIKTQADYDALLVAVKHYAQSAEPPFVKHFDTFMGCWRDWIEKPPISAPIAIGSGRGFTPPMPPVQVGGKVKL